MRKVLAEDADFGIIGLCETQQFVTNIFGFFFGEQHNREITSSALISSRKLPLGGGIEHIDLQKARNGTSMAYSVGLARLAFAIIGCTIEFVGGFPADTIAGIPEIGRARLISHIAQHFTDFSL